MPEFHNIPPIFDSSSRALILGSFPSSLSRKAVFYYANVQNRFWRVLCEILGAPLLETDEQKSALLLHHNIALWDVAASCDISKSSDSSIRSVLPNDIERIIASSDIKFIFTNGAAAHKLYSTLILPRTKLEAHRLPSTSSANAAFSFERLVEEWSIVAAAVNAKKES
ncbi:MAG: DNA-deoxyinosine glycosylase [Oscillospiraceae bacterium]